MAVSIGWVGGVNRRPENLLDACLFWDRCQGGTIHQYLPRLRWERGTGPSVARMGGPVYRLMLDNTDIGWVCGRKSELPKIDASFPAYHLDYLPVGCEWAV